MKAKKKRKIKSLKDKFRMKRAEKARSDKQNSWKKFADKKATKRKVGFMTGTEACTFVLPSSSPPLSVADACWLTLMVLLSSFSMFGQV